MSLFDTHCHLDFDVFDGQRLSLMQECQSAGINRIVVPAVGKGNWSKCLALANEHEMLDCALGIHPYFVENHQDQDILALAELIAKERERIVAVGEIGLDDTRSDFDLQCVYFERQLALAEQYRLPVIMHMRRNHGQGLKRVKKFSLVGGVVHAFSGSLSDALAWLDLGLKLGVGGVVTYERAEKTRNTFARLPLDSLVLETDAPDMAVQGVPKGEGTSLMVRRVFDALCEIRTESPEVLEQALWNTSSRLFEM